MSNLTQWSAIVAFFIPLIVAFLNQQKWTAQAKAVVFFVVAVVAAGMTAYLQGDLTGKRWLDSALIIVAAGAAFYHGFWKPIGTAPKIEKATSFK